MFASAGAWCTAGAVGQPTGACGRRRSGRWSNGERPREARRTERQGTRLSALPLKAHRERARASDALLAQSHEPVVEQGAESCGAYMATANVPRSSAPPSIDASVRSALVIRAATSQTKRCRPDSTRPSDPESCRRSAHRRRSASWRRLRSDESSVPFGVPATNVGNNSATNAMGRRCTSTSTSTVVAPAAGSVRC